MLDDLQVQTMWNQYQCYLLIVSANDLLMIPTRR